MKFEIYVYSFIAFFCIRFFVLHNKHIHDQYRVDSDFVHKVKLFASYGIESGQTPIQFMNAYDFIQFICIFDSMEGSRVKPFIEHRDAYKNDSIQTLFSDYQNMEFYTKSKSTRNPLWSEILFDNEYNELYTILSCPIASEGTNDVKGVLCIGVLNYA